jgi:hypothetical protein
MKRVAILSTLIAAPMRDGLMRKYDPVRLQNATWRAVPPHARCGRVADEAHRHLGAEPADTCGYALILLNVQFEQIDLAPVP